jgi:protein-tyrosine phosphatase
MQLFTVILDDGPGKLSTMAHPRGGADLAEDMTALRSAGVDVLVSALTESELDETELHDEVVSAEKAGLRFVSLPIADRGLPDHSQVLPTLRSLAVELGTGIHVVTHCWSGIGRSSLLTATIMVLTGVAPDDAWRLISEARGCTVPETTAQRDWIFGLS